MDTTGSDSLITVRELSKVYIMGADSLHALDRVSLAIDAGTYVAVMGPSGSGKTTFLDILGCLSRPTSGEYWLNGHKVSEYSESQLARIRNREIGFVFQNFNLLPRSSALQNVELPLIYRGIPAAARRAMAVEALSRMGLGARLRHRPGQMSGGQQQRVAIARAIAASPPIVLADEPTGNLDSASGREVMETLAALNREGRTIVLITHDASVAARAARRVRIADGRIVE